MNLPTRFREEPRKESSVSIADVVETVREKAPYQGDETSTAEIFDILKDSGASMRTVQRVLGDASVKGYLRKGKKRGKWRLGHKPISQ